MADKEAGVGAVGTEKEETMTLEEEVVTAEVAAVEEAEEATATKTMQEEVMATSMEAEAVEAITMDIRTTSISQINTLSRISNNHRCPQRYHCCTQYQDFHHQHTRATICIVMPIKWVAMPTVANGATKGSSNGRDQPHLIQRASLR